MPIEVLRDAMPKRLVRRGDGWCLEYERFVPLGEGVLRPRLERLLGEASIVHFLERHPMAPSLLRAAVRLLRESPPAPGEPSTFEATPEGWVPVVAPPPPLVEDEEDREMGRGGPTLSLRRPQPTAGAGQPEPTDAEPLLAEIQRLRSERDALEARVRELEAFMAIAGHALPG